MEKFNIDIILPNYNKSNYLEEAINSFLDQTFKNCHINKNYNKVSFLKNVMSILGISFLLIR